MDKNTDELKISKFFAQNISKDTKYLYYFHKFSVQDHLHEHFCTFVQFHVVSGFASVALIYFCFYNKKRAFGWGNTSRN